MSFLSKLFGTDKKPERVYNRFGKVDKLTEAQIKSIHDEIISLLKSTRRYGIDSVIEYMEKNGFFIVPASVHHHHNWKGGLAQHSLDVYYKSKAQNDGTVTSESLIIACLLHDICKSDELCYDKEGNLCRSTKKHRGHGGRSVAILEKCKLDMLDSEFRAIRWHMGGHNAHSEENAEVNLTRRERLWQILHYVDKSDAGRDT